MHRFTAIKHPYTLAILCCVLFCVSNVSSAQSFHRDCGVGRLVDDATGSCGNAETILSRDGDLFWVDQATGNDGNPGTKSRPWKTISRANKAGQLTPGDAVLVRAGTYREEIRPRSAGASGRLITFAAYPGDVVTVSGSDIVNRPNSGYNGWKAQKRRLLAPRLGLGRASLRRLASGGSPSRAVRRQRGRSAAAERHLAPDRRSRPVLGPGQRQRPHGCLPAHQRQHQSERAVRRGRPARPSLPAPKPRRVHALRGWLLPCAPVPLYALDVQAPEDGRLHGLPGKPHRRDRDGLEQRGRHPADRQRPRRARCHREQQRNRGHRRAGL